MDSSEYLNECYVKQRTIKDVFSYTSFVNRSIYWKEETDNLQLAVKDCQIRLFVLSQMCTNMNKQKEKGKKEKERGIEQFHSSKYSSLSINDLDDYTIQIPSALQNTLESHLLSAKQQILLQFQVQHVKDMWIDIPSSSQSTTKWKGYEKWILPFAINYEMDESKEEKQASPIHIQIPSRKTSRKTIGKTTSKTTSKRSLKPIITPILDYSFTCFQSKCFSSSETMKRHSSILTVQDCFYQQPIVSTVSLHTVESFINSIYQESHEEKADPIEDDWNERETDPIEDDWNKRETDPIEDESTETNRILTDEELFQYIEENSMDMVDFIEKQAIPTFDLLEEEQQSSHTPPSKKLKTLSIQPSSFLSKFNHMHSNSTKYITTIIQHYLDQHHSTNDVMNDLRNQQGIQFNTKKEENHMQTTIAWMLVCLIHTFNTKDSNIRYKMESHNKVITAFPLKE